MRRQSCKIIPPKKDPTFVRSVKAVYAIQHRGLASAIRTDDGQQFTLTYIETDVHQSLSATKCKVDIFHTQLNGIIHYGFPVLSMH